MNTRVHLVSWALSIVMLCGVANAEIPQVISYQGKVTDASGNPVADGTYTMRFRIYDAVTNGTLKWDSGATSAAIAGGVFSVMLGESPQPALNLAFDADYWLAVTFAGVDQTPRQRMASSGYAYMASGVVAGTEVSGSVSSGTSSALRVANTATTGLTYGLHAVTSSISGQGVHGEATATTGTNYGGRFESASSSGRGVYGQVYATTGNTYGVHGVSSSTAGTGVLGYVTATTGLTCGVHGECVSPNGLGVLGVNTSTTGVNYGGRFESASSSGRGVYGQVSATTGNTYGVHGVSSSTAGTGVLGYATASTGTAYGVQGESASTLGIGVRGAATATTGPVHGGYFEVWSTSGYGAYGHAMAATGSSIAVYGRNESNAGYGVYGSTWSTTGATYGVYGRSYSNAGTGVYGDACGGPGVTYGGQFVSTSPQGIGVYGKGGTDGYAGMFEGNVAVKSLTSGSIVLELGEGLDYAEGFDVADAEGVGPGTVLVIDPSNDGSLAPSCRPYDMRVAGIVAGANGIGSGVRLGVGRFDHNVALAGRVYCNVDATEFGIEPGDLLTTSATKGYAMKAIDHGRARGAILGKAMERLEKGRKGQILVLVTLQ